ncbi:MAG: hypothetical protein ACLR7D_13360 [Lachnospira eligens]
MSEHVPLYGNSEQKIADSFSEDELVKGYTDCLRAVDKDSTKDSMLKCIRDVNGVTDQR